MTAVEKVRHEIYIAAQTLRAAVDARRASGLPEVARLDELASELSRAAMEWDGSRQAIETLRAAMEESIELLESTTPERVLH